MMIAKPFYDSKKDEITFVSRTCFRHYLVFAQTRSKLTTAISFSRQNDTGSLARRAVRAGLEPATSGFQNQHPNGDLGRECNHSNERGGRAAGYIYKRGQIVDLLATVKQLQPAF